MLVGAAKAGGSRRISLGFVVPGQPFLGMFEQHRGVFDKCSDVVKGIDLCQVTGMDQAHKQIPDVGAVLGFIKQRIFSMQNGFFQRLFTKVMPPVVLCRVYSHQLQIHLSPAIFKLVYAA